MTERVPAADDFSTIRSRIEELRSERTATCPQFPSRKLYDCLRSPTRCSAECEHVNDWIGPQP